MFFQYYWQGIEFLCFILAVICGFCMIIGCILAVLYGVVEMTIWILNKLSKN